MKAGTDYIGVTVASFCHDGAGEFAFHKRSANCDGEPLTWDCAGGRVEMGETPEQAALRELEQEYGCTGVIEAALPANSYIREKNGRMVHWIVLPFIVRVKRQDVRINEPDKADDIGFFRLDNLPSPLHSGLAEDLKNYHNELAPYAGYGNSH